jgi:23S rRNA (cytosine1962-C5)-methyltransferase
VWTAEKTEDGASLLRKNLEEAFLRRKDFSERGSFRLVFSEADFLPGLIVDYYSGVVVVQTNTAGMDAVLDLIQDLLPKIFESVFRKKLEGLVVRADTGIRRLEGIENFSRVVMGEEESLRSGEFSEGGVRYAVDFIGGQKTGFFLDQAGTRDFLSRSVRQTKPKRVLDLFCYSGGWGLRALTEGAGHVTFVDSSREALELVRRGLGLNGLPPERCDMIQADIFDYLEREGGPFDMVVADPPAFAKSKKDLPQAMKAYESLNRLCWGKLRAGGLLMTSSCSHHLKESDFLEALSRAVASEHGYAHLIYRGMQAGDHPVLLSMPETSYLKCVGLRKLGRSGMPGKSLGLSESRQGLV